MKVQRYKCKECGNDDYERVSFVKGNRSYSNRFAKYVVDLLRALTIQEVSKRLSVSWDVVKGIHTTYLKRHYSKPSLQAVSYTHLQVANSFPDLHIKIAGTSSLPREVYAPLLEGMKEVELVFDDTYRVVKGARAALVTSGTATLETALLGTPQVVCYAQRAGYLANFIFKHLFTTPYICLLYTSRCV